jgi:toxin ParE1/3/4
LKLSYSERAAHQIEAALDYIAERSPRGAKLVQQRLLRVERLLQNHPHIGHATSRSHIRRLALTSHPYLIDYLLADDEIIVLRFRHSARRPL